jgi:hypothetical protein
MLPVGEAEAVGANINTNTERRVHKIEDTLDRFIAASVGTFGNAQLQPLREPRVFRDCRPVQLAGLPLNLEKPHQKKEPGFECTARVMPK